MLDYLAEAMKKPLPAHALTPFKIAIACQLEKIRAKFSGQPATDHPAVNEELYLSYILFKSETKAGFTFKFYSS